MLEKGTKVYFCNDCEDELKFIGDRNTDWYGILEYYECSTCKEEFIRKEGQEPELI